MIMKGYCLGCECITDLEIETNVNVHSDKTYGLCKEHCS